MPRLTIITINRNNAEGLDATLRSVWERQTFDDFEQIVIDGASTDDSVDVIRKYEGNLAYWVSEPDKGIYHAMNKGIARSKGDYLLFLNSGDWLEDDALAHVFGQEFSEDIVYADLYFYYDADHKVLGAYPDKLTLPILLEGSLGHPSAFIKRELFDDMLYDEEYRIVSDWIFFVKQIVLLGRTTRHLRQAVSCFNMCGISTNPENKELISQERTRFLETEFPSLIGGLYQEYTVLREKARVQQQALNIMSKGRTQQLLDSVWIQRKARQYIKLLFGLKKIFGGTMPSGSHTCTPK